MDFMTHLPRSSRGHDAVWVIMGRLSKWAHFLVLQMTFTLEEFGKLYIREIVRLHGVPIYIVLIGIPSLRLIFERVSSESWGHS